MKPSTRLDSAIFQLTPTRTRCDLFAIANDKKEKIASGLLNPFLAHLKTAQEQIAKGGYSISLELEPGVDSSWFTKGTLERFVRFVSTPEILERVYTIESEILQIEEAIALHGNNNDGPNKIEDNQVKPVVIDQGQIIKTDADEEKALVLYEPGENVSDVNNPVEPEVNSKVQFLKALDTRKTMLQKEQGMAFARALAAGYDMDHLTLLLSFAKCFGASRFMDACTKFMNLWKEKHESGQWLDIEEVESMSMKSDFSAMDASGIMLSSVSNKHNEFKSPVKHGKGDADASLDERPSPDQTQTGQQEYFPGQFPHPMYPPYPMYSPPGTVPVYPAYPMQGMPFYHPGNGQLYHPEDHRTGKERESVDNKDSRSYTGSETSEIDAPKSKSGKKKSGRVVIRNINYITSKARDFSGSEDSVLESDSNSDSKSKRKIKHEKSKDEDITNGKETDGGHWNAFESCLVRDADEDNHVKNKVIYEMEDGQTIRRNGRGDDPLAYGGEEGLYSGNRECRDDIQSTEVNERKILHTTTNDDFMIGSLENQLSVRNSSEPLDLNGFEGNLEKSSSLEMADESFIVPFRSMSVDQNGTELRTTIDMDYEVQLQTQNSEVINYEPDDLSLVPERGLEKTSVGYDPALDFEMQFQIHESDEKNKEDSDDGKEVFKDSDKDNKSKVTPDSADKKKTGGQIRKGKLSKMSPLEEARARAEKLRTYKADLQKIKKEKEEEEKKRIEALKMERQKRIAARGNPGSTSLLPQIPSPQTKKQLPKITPISHRGSKFSDAEPGSASPLQRSKLRTSSLMASDSRKITNLTRSIDDSRMIGNRMNRSVSSLSEAKDEISGGFTPDSKASMARIRRLSEPKKINRLKSSDEPESKKISAIINLDRSKAATLPELKIKARKSGLSSGQKAKAIENKVLTESDGDENHVVEKNVVMFEREKPSVSVSEENTSVEKGHSGNYDVEEKTEVTVADFVPIRAPPSPIDSDDKEPTPSVGVNELLSYNEAIKSSEESSKSSNRNIKGKSYEASHSRNSSIEDPCTRNSEYGKAPETSSDTITTNILPVKAHVSDFEKMRLDKIPEASEKPQVKDSSKGIKRFLKLGRKNSSSAAESVSATTADVSPTDDNPNEVYTLKNLISQDKTPTGATTSQKSSRHFSLFSPFRSKTSDKKATA